MLLLLLNYVVLRALWKIDVYLKSTLVNKSLYYYYYLSDFSPRNTPSMKNGANNSISSKRVLVLVHGYLDKLLVMTSKRVLVLVHGYLDK